MLKADENALKRIEELAEKRKKEILGEKERFHCTVRTNTRISRKKMQIFSVFFEKYIAFFDCFCYNSIRRTDTGRFLALRRIFCAKGVRKKE